MQGIVPEEKDAADLLDQAQQLAKLNSKPTDLQVRQLVDNTRAAIQDERFDQATKLLMQARLLAPRITEVQKALSDLKEQLVNNARTAIKAGRFDQATNLLSYARLLAPQDPDVQKASNDLKEAQATQQVGQLVTDARTAIQAGRFDQATNLLMLCTPTGTQDPDVQKASNDLKEAQTTQQVGQLVTDARTAIQAGRFDQAITLLGNASRLAPQDPDVQKTSNDLKQAQTTQQVRQLVTDARTAIQAGRFDQATTLLGNASRLAPQDPDVRKPSHDLKQAQATQQVRQLVTDARTAIQAGRFDQATTLLGNASRLHPGSRCAKSD